MSARVPGCECQQEIGDSPCPVHDCSGADAPDHVRAWVDFLRTVNIRGPIAIRFRVHHDRNDAWLLESKMRVPDRDGVGAQTWITFQNVLPVAKNDDDRRLAIRQRVLGMYQHEALENIYIGGERAFDPHEARWYSNLVVDWRYNV